MVLERIVSDKRQEVNRLKSEIDSSLLADLPLSDRSLADALRKPHTGYIMECKKASPSKGLIRHDFNPAAIAKDYEPFADAISVLTDEKYFQGKLDYLSAVRSAVRLPVVCKDFILEPFQVRLARKYGADAILLMLSVLDDGQFGDCLEEAQRLQMDALVEVRDKTEMERASLGGAKIIGINNRDLSTLKVDLTTTKNLAHLAPKESVLVSESGFFTHSDVRPFRSCANAFLVGTSLMQKENVERGAKELVFGVVKVCGLTSVKDALKAEEAGALYGGVIFARESKRRVDLDTAKKISEGTSLCLVGVFVDAPVKEVLSNARALSLRAVQLHGEETPSYIEALRKSLPKEVEIWKAVRVADSVPDAKDFGADRLLLDTFVKGERGGTGMKFNWSLLKDRDLSKVIVAGGLSLDNAKEADSLSAYALDVNSGVEDAPGKKSSEKLRDFFAELRGKGRE